jgi:pilus assembly protein CpaF
MIKTDIASTINFVVHVERLSDGRRRVMEVVEVIGRKGDDYETREIFKWSQANGFKSQGIVPRFVENPSHPEMQLTKEFFAPGYKYKPAA